MPTVLCGLPSGFLLAEGTTSILSEGNGTFELFANDRAVVDCSAQPHPFPFQFGDRIATKYTFKISSSNRAKIAVLIRGSHNALKFHRRPEHRR